MNDTTHGSWRETVLQQVKTIILNILDDTAADVYLFGSWARNEEKQSSDIDVALEFKTSGVDSQLIMINIREALEESTVPYRVDVVHMNTADAYIVEKIQKEGIRWTKLTNASPSQIEH